MIYTRRSTDGPAKGNEFQDYGLPVAIEIPYSGQVLKYHLVSTPDCGCIYRLCGLSDEGGPLLFPF